MTYESEHAEHGEGFVPGADELLDEQLAAYQPPSFAELGVMAPHVEALASVGITHPFPIQSMTLPVALSGHDIIGQAKTGTGKTLGFGLPLLQRAIARDEPGYEALDMPGAPQALVVVPTRELAVQVAKDLEQAGSRRAISILTVYGGRAYEPQIDALRRGVDVVVGTPGRLLDLAQQGHLRLGYVRTAVLDEADEMLDLGFLGDVEKLLDQTPAGRQTMLFSATMPGPVVALARRFMTQPTHIRAADPTDTGATVKAIAQFVYRAHSMDKIEMLARLLQADGRGLTMVFARTKRTCDKVAAELVERGFAAAAIHGDLGQGAREQALRAFRNGKIDVLVATDVAARGIDVDDVTHVVNYSCTEDEKIYLHRTGRTGRAGNIGTAVTFVDWDDLPRWGLIDRALDLGIPDPPETYSSSPSFFADLKIPAGTKGTLPRGSQVRAGLRAEAVEDLGETGKGGRGSSDSGRGRGGRDAGRRDSGGRDGGRDSGGRDSAGRGGREGSHAGEVRSEAHGLGADTTERVPREAREPGRRTRTRGGHGATGSEAGSPTNAEAKITIGAPADHDPTSSAAKSNRRSRSRRRTRGGAAAAGAPTGDSSTA